MSRELKKLILELNKISATNIQVKMAVILLKVNGFNSSMKFIEQIKICETKQLKLFGDEI